MGVVVGLAAEARIARRLGWPVAVGGGQTEAGAVRAVDSLLAQGCTALLSFGVCGGLDPARVPGDLVVPDAVTDGNTLWPVDPGLRARLGGGAGGIVFAGPLLPETEDKRRVFRGLGAVAVDVESAAVARAGLPFAVLRAVCDPADRALPRVAQVALDDRGRIAIGAVLGAFLAQPGQLGALLKLGRDAGRARRALLRRVDTLGSDMRAGGAPAG